MGSHGAFETHLKQHTKTNTNTLCIPDKFICCYVQFHPHCWRKHSWQIKGTKCLLGRDCLTSLTRGRVAENLIFAKFFPPSGFLYHNYLTL